MSRFTVLLTPDLESGGYTVTVPALPGCVTDGATVEEAPRRAEEAISLYLEDEAEASLPSPRRAEVIVASVDVATSA